MSNTIQAAITELDGQARRIVQAIAALRALDTESQPDAPQPVKLCNVSAPAPKARVKRAIKNIKKVTPVMTRTSDDRNPPGALQSAVLSVLNIAPASSREVFDRLTANGVKTTQDSIYQTCAALKSKREIETKLDEKDGVRRWYLAPDYGQGATA